MDGYKVFEEWAIVLRWLGDYIYLYAAKPIPLRNEKNLLSRFYQRKTRDR